MKAHAWAVQLNSSADALINQRFVTIIGVPNFRATEVLCQQPAERQGCCPYLGFRSQGVRPEIFELGRIFVEFRVFLAVVGDNYWFTNCPLDK